MQRVNRRMRRSCVFALVLFAGAATGFVPAVVLGDTPGVKEPAKPDRKAEVGDVDLRPKWEKGVLTRYSIQQESKSSTANPQDPKAKIESKTKQTIGLSLKVIDVKPDGVATVEMVYDSLKIEMSTADMDVTYDSTTRKGGKNAAPGKSTPGKKPAGELDDIIGPMFDNIVGSKLTLTMDRDGNISEVKGGEALNALGSIGGAGIDPKSMGQLFGQISPGKNGGVHKVGDKWTNKDPLNVGPLGEFTMITEHTLNSHRGQRAEVSVNGRAEADSESGAAMSPDKIKLKHTTYKGKYVWDTGKGRLLSFEMEQSLAVGGALEATSSGTTKITIVK